MTAEEFFKKNDFSNIDHNTICTYDYVIYDAMIKFSQYHIERIKEELLEIYGKRDIEAIDIAEITELNKIK